MGRYGRRVSRSLIGILLVTLALLLVSYLKRPGTTQAEESAPVAIAPAPAPIASSPVKKPVAPPREIATAMPEITTTVTPSAAPTPQSQLALAPETSSDPTTKPSESAAPAVENGNTLAAAQSKKDAGDLLAARKILNDALLANALSASDTTAAKKSMADMNQTVVFSPKRFADDEFGGTYSVQTGDVLQKIATKYDITWEALLRLNGMTDPKKLRAGQTLKVIHGPFSAVVYKGQFLMDIYLGAPMQKGSMYVTTYSVGLGKDDSTPTGSWLVESGKKIKNPTYYSPRGEGIIDADDPKNPLGERWIGLTGIDGHALGKSSYGIHGTIDESSIGHQESMGCIRMHNADVEWVFDLLVEGKSVVVVKD